MFFLPCACKMKSVTQMMSHCSLVAYLSEVPLRGNRPPFWSCRDEAERDRGRVRSRALEAPSMYPLSNLCRRRASAGIHPPHLIFMEGVPLKLRFHERRERKRTKNTNSSHSASNILRQWSSLSLQLAHNNHRIRFTCH